MSKKFLRVAFPLLLLFAACNKPDVVEEKTFVDTYAQLLIIKSSTTDSVAAADGVRAALEAHHVTKEQMQEQLKRYADDPARYRRVLEEINARLRALDSAAGRTPENVR